jgi:hypothetical protein
MGIDIGGSGSLLIGLEILVPSAAEVATRQVSSTFFGYYTSYSMGPHCLLYYVPLGPAVQYDPWLMQWAQRFLDSRRRGLAQFYSSTIGTVVAPWPSVFRERYGVGLGGSQPNQSRMFLLLIGVRFTFLYKQSYYASEVEPETRDMESSTAGPTAVVLMAEAVRCCRLVL